ncbi:uncharacterized protein LY89DRAFT_674721 [Mollisia scopiformis]|uniref:Uncharacterized protein n=1 Tax=Mollisia scopiformis TaxID=149040 RepID=A0A194WUQ4_MOLSC|nr:uncharacterized protein LY89DRAFT_674721 [Mollisia scopiformis]KUJ11404.1 hypothetical protein LY89DRAFT_674721 [Mollisia scopiformis]
MPTLSTIADIHDVNEHMDTVQAGMSEVKGGFEAVNSAIENVSGVCHGLDAMSQSKNLIVLQKELTKERRVLSCTRSSFKRGSRWFVEWPARFGVAQSCAGPRSHVQAALRSSAAKYRVQPVTVLLYKKNEENRGRFISLHTRQAAANDVLKNFGQQFSNVVTKPEMANMQTSLTELQSTIPALATVVDTQDILKGVQNLSIELTEVAAKSEDMDYLNESIRDVSSKVNTVQSSMQALASIADVQDISTAIIKSKQDILNQIALNVNAADVDTKFEEVKAQVEGVQSSLPAVATVPDLCDIEAINAVATNNRSEIIDEVKAETLKYRNDIVTELLHLPSKDDINQHIATLPTKEELKVDMTTAMKDILTEADFVAEVTKLNDSTKDLLQKGHFDTKIEAVTTTIDTLLSNLKNEFLFVEQSQEASRVAIKDMATELVEVSKNGDNISEKTQEIEQIVKNVRTSLYDILARTDFGGDGWWTNQQGGNEEDAPDIGFPKSQQNPKRTLSSESSEHPSSQHEPTPRPRSDSDPLGIYHDDSDEPPVARPQVESPDLDVRSEHDTSIVARDFASGGEESLLFQDETDNSIEPTLTPLNQHVDVLRGQKHSRPSTMESMRAEQSKAAKASDGARVPSGSKSTAAAAGPAPSPPSSGTWRKVSVGPKAGGKEMRAALKSVLGTKIGGLVHARDIKVGKKGGHRLANAELNAERPTVCWMAQYSLDKDWPAEGYPKLPSGRPGADHLENLKKWWGEKWVDTNKACPHCEWMKGAGNEASCFYFVDTPEKEFIQLHQYVRLGKGGPTNLFFDDHHIHLLRIPATTPPLAFRSEPSTQWDKN